VTGPSNDADTPSAPERIGVFGGTFDPPHAGHVAVAATVRWALHLDRVLLMVANDPWQKRGTRAISEAADRLAMTEMAVAGIEGLEASALEIDRGGATYSIDTLIELERSHPGAELYLVVGSDAAAGLDTWERADEVRARCRLVVIERPGSTAAELPAGWTAHRVTVPSLELSSTELRERRALGAPLDGLVPPAVMAVIAERGLYGGPSL
jgi:nicotinate-nucleotide adenylyltransferase